MPSHVRVHYKYRMVLALLTMLALFAVTTAFVGIPTSRCKLLEITVGMWSLFGHPNSITLYLVSGNRLVVGQ